MSEQQTTAQSRPAYNIPPQPQGNLPPKKVRRVGTVTFGLVLVTAGVLMIAYLLVPGFDLIGIVKFSPVVLIFLGIEVLVGAAKPDRVLKYDFLSMFAIALILCVVGGASVVSWFGLYDVPYATDRIGAALKEQIYSALNSDASLKEVVQNVETSIHVTGPLPADATDGQLRELNVKAGDEATLRITLLHNKISDETVFADVCRRIIDACTTADVQVSQYYIYCDDDGIGQSFVLTQDAAWVQGMTTAQLTERVSSRYYADGNNFDSVAARDNYLKEEYRAKLQEEYAAAHDGEYPGDEYMQQKVEEYMAARFPAATPETAR